MTVSTRTPYSYRILRYVHDTGTGEFLNVGIVLMAPRAMYFQAKVKSAISRVKAAFPGIDTNTFKLRMRRVQSCFDTLAEGDLSAGQSRLVASERAIEDVVHRVIPADDSSLQWSPTGSGLTADPAATLASLYKRFVSKYDADGSHVRKDDDVWKHFRQELKRRNVLPQLEEKTIAVSDDSVRFTHAWKNGVWHCYEALSFDLATEEGIKDKAVKWLGQVNSVQNSTDPFNVYFLVGAPSHDNLEEAYRKAVSILRKTPLAKVIEEKDAETFAGEVAQEMTRHDGQNLT